MSETFERTYVTVINSEEQYSIWIASREIPPGWREAGLSGTRAECLDFISTKWTDLRPRSLRKPVKSGSPAKATDSTNGKASKTQASKSATAGKTTTAKKKKPATTGNSSGAAKKTTAKKKTTAGPKKKTTKKSAGKKAGK